MTTTNGNDPVYLYNNLNKMGLSKRELFAKDILCALISSRGGKFGITNQDLDHYIARAITTTDTFIFALNNPDKDH